MARRAEPGDVIPVLPARDVSEAVQFYVERLFEEYKDKGVFHERTQLGDTSWGTREFAFRDLNHNGLTFVRDI